MLEPMTWIFWAVLSAVFAAATALLAKVGVSGIDSNLATAIRTTVILVFTWAIAIAFEKHHALTQIGRRSWVFLVLSGICTGLSWLCYFRAKICACSGQSSGTMKPRESSATVLTPSLANAATIVGPC